jgi:hypothetical protein
LRWGWSSPTSESVPWQIGVNSPGCAVWQGGNECSPASRVFIVFSVRGRTSCILPRVFLLAIARNKCPSCEKLSCAHDFESHLIYQTRKGKKVLCIYSSFFYLTEDLQTDSFRTLTTGRRPPTPKQMSQFPCQLSEFHLKLDADTV